VTATRSILVPLLLDPETERAIPHAVRLSQLTGDPLVLFTWSFDDGEAGLEELHLDAIARTLPVPTTVEARTTSEPSPAPAIARAAAAHDALVVMASHGRTGVGEAVFGSVAEDVLRRARRPVVLVGPNASDPLSGDPGLVVAGVDGSDLAEAAMATARDLALRIGADLQLVEVLEPDLVAAVNATGGDVSEWGYLARASAGLPDPLHAGFEVLHGAAAAALAGYEPDRTELLAVATHGRSGMARMVLGSVAMDVVRHASSPVLVTPATSIR
jgi:nucleotide-binding universal stress UspA family protein